MKPIFVKIILLAGFLIFCGKPVLVSANSDTTYVQTFTFGSKQDSSFVFPKLGGYRKVLMYYTLKCNPKQSPACGQWDYLTYTYLYQHTGITDSSIARIDSTFDAIKKKYTKDTVWKKYERLTQFELGRYITPYGINLSLGNGFTWTYDVTDYMSLLHDTVHLAAGNWQELLDLKFVFVKGTPPRMPYKVLNMWNGNFNYGGPTSFGDILRPKKITVDYNASYTKLIARVTGHGEDGSNCAEFCGKMHWLNVDGTQRWTQLVWRDNCAFSPLPAQGGTWLFQRANWCPGAEVQTYSGELTPYVTAGKSSTFVYDAEPYTTTTSNSGNSNPYYALETQLIYYGKANFTLNAGVENILSPSTDNMFLHDNPVCANPRIVIRNNGTTTLTSLRIDFGTTTGPQSSYNWNGKLEFMQTDTVTLGQFYWTNGGGPYVFQVHLSGPNGANDEYAPDDVMYSKIPITQKLPNKFIIQCKTNSSAKDNAYTITDASGNIRYHREYTSNSTLYRDTVSLANGCYQFRFTDAGQDGLSFFANPGQGAGTLRLATTSNATIKNFNPDFGAEVLMSFNVGYGLAIQPDATIENIDVFPNPSSGIVNVDATTLMQKPFKINIYDLLGKEVYTQTVKESDDHALKIDLSDRPSGVYILSLSNEDQVYTKQVVLK
jgi:hypothetical protein